MPSLFSSATDKDFAVASLAYCDYIANLAINKLQILKMTNENKIPKLMFLV